MSKVCPYGSWKSPITSDMVAQSTVGLGQVEIEDKTVYWIEMRPAEQGRCVIVKHPPDGKTVEVNPPPFNARTTVHEYGGGSYKANKGTIYYANFNDQRLFKIEPGERQKPITPKTQLRYADLAFDNRRGRILST